jgi:hypothetical protein
MPWTQKYIVFDQLITIPQIYATSELCLQVIMAIIVTVKIVWGPFTSCRSNLTFGGMWQFGLGYYYMIIKVLKNYDNFSQL